MHLYRTTVATVAFTLAVTHGLDAQRAPKRRRAPAARIADSARIAIESATLAGDLTALATVRTTLDKSLKTGPADPLILHYLGYALYRMANLRDGIKETPALIADLAASRQSLQRSLQRRPMAESCVLLATVEQRLAGLDPAHAKSLDADATKLLERGIALGPDNPRVYLLAAISALYTPTAAGGGDAAAEQLLAHAISLFAKDHPAPPAPAWGRSESYAWLGQVYDRTGRRRKALAAYNHALKLDPEFTWVRDVLRPAVLKNVTNP